MVTLGDSILKSWSKRQTVIAMSSAEAEYYALAKGAVESLGVKAIMMDLGVKADVRIWLDSSAAKAIASREGLGRTRHIDVQYLWIQDLTRRGVIRLKKIGGRENPSDMMTKPKSLTEMRELLKILDVKLIGRSSDPGGSAEGG